MRDMKKGYGDDRGYFTPDGDDAPIARDRAMSTEERITLDTQRAEDAAYLKQLTANREIWIDNLPSRIAGLSRTGWEMFDDLSNFVVSLQTKMSDEGWEMERVEEWVKNHSFCE